MNIADDIRHQIDMRGTLALCARGILGVITSRTKINGAYVGLNLDGEPWQTKAPTATFGTVAEWNTEDRPALCWWLEQKGATREMAEQPDLAGAGRKLEKVAREVGLL